MHRLYTSGLMDECEFIHIGVVGDNEMFTVPPKAKVHKNERLTKDEGETVEAMYRFCCNPDIIIIMYYSSTLREQADSLFLNFMHGDCS